MDDAIARPPIQRFMPTPAYRARRLIIDRISRIAMFCAAALSVLITTGIVYVLVSESWGFFTTVPLLDFLTDTQWTPVFANPRFGIWPLLTATLWAAGIALLIRSEEHTSELQSLMRISYAVFCLKKKTKQTITTQTEYTIIDII